MVVALSDNRTVRAPATALLFAAWLLCSPGRADASCGDYVTIAGQPAASDHAVPSSDQSERPVPGQPCHGPNCSAQQHPPAAPPVSPPTDPKQPDARVGTAELPDAEPGHRFIEPAAGRPIRIPVVIFRPPPR